MRGASRFMEEIGPANVRDGGILDAGQYLSEVDILLVADDVMSSASVSSIRVHLGRSRADVFTMRERATPANFRGDDAEW